LLASHFGFRYSLFFRFLLCFSHFLLAF
jgi:hypothetical protein